MEGVEIIVIRQQIFAADEEAREILTLRMTYDPPNVPTKQIKIKGKIALFKR